jgi:hypothetical protein
MNLTDYGMYEAGHHHTHTHMRRFRLCRLVQEVELHDLYSGNFHRILATPLNFLLTQTFDA